MKKSERNILIAIILIAIVVYGYTQGWFNQFLPSQSTVPPPQTTTPGERQNYEQGIGTYNVRTSAHCSLDMATTYTIGTNCKVYWYKRHGTEWISVATGDNQYVTLKPEDNGYLWIVVTIPSGQNYYVDYQKILSANSPDVDMYLYTDVDGDLVKEFAFRYNVKGVAIPSSGYPVVWFYVFLLPYDTSFTGLNDLSNDTGIGGSTTTKYYDYYLAFSASKKAVAIYKVELRIGTTDETKFEFKRLEIPGIGLVDGKAFTETITTSDIRYTYTISTSFDGALYLSLMPNQQNKFWSRLTIEWHLSSGDEIQVTLIYYYFDATESGQSTSDSFYATYA